MSTSQPDRTLQPGDVAPNVVLDAITRQGKVAVDDYRGRTPVLISMFRGLHCPYCRRHIAALAQLEPALREKGIDMLTVINTPVERARLYFRYRPMPNLLAAADPERASHRAFGLPNFEFTQDESDWPRKVAMNQMMSMKINVTGELGLRFCIHPPWAPWAKSASVRPSSRLTSATSTWSLASREILRQIKWMGR